MNMQAARRRALPGGVLLLALALAGLVAVQARAAESELTVGPLGIVSGKATGSISGFTANGQVTVDGRTQQANEHGTVTLAGAPLDGDGVLTIGFTDAAGKPQTVTVDLSDAVTGLPLSPAQLLDPAADATREVSVTVGGGSGGAGTGGGTSGGGSSTVGAPAGATTTPAGVSIPAGSVVAPDARLVIAKVAFTPLTVRSRTKPIGVRVTVKDTRGYLVRGAIVFIRGVPERRVVAVAEKTTNVNGVVAFTLKPTKLLPLRPGGRLTMFVRARKQGEPVNAGVSTRKLVSLRLARPR